MSEDGMSARPTDRLLADRLAEQAEASQVPGAAVGIFHDGQEQYAFHGVTNIEHPLPVDEATLFQIGSTGKTYTAAAIMRLVEQGRVSLSEKVRTYVPELRLKDPEVARDVTVLQVLNHSAGWQGDFFVDTGDGDDALAKFIDLLPTIEQEFPPGEKASYNNAAFALAGRILEKVTGDTYEQAIQDLLLEPLGLSNSLFFPRDVMTRRFTVGHEAHEDGSLGVAHPWGDMRSGNATGGMASDVGDQVAWARFHLGDGKGVDGSQVLTRETLELMRRPTVEADGGGALGDHVGISWMLHDIDGVRSVKHGGSINGQQSAFQLIPERDFAMTVLTNASPNGIELHTNLVRWALEAYLGVVDRIPEPVARPESDLAQYTGDYARIKTRCQVSIDGGGLLLVVESTEADGEEGADEDEEDEVMPPFPLGMLPDSDRFVVTDGPYRTMRGVFTRNPAGAIDAIHLGGRLMFKQ